MGFRRTRLRQLKRFIGNVYDADGASVSDDDIALAAFTTLRSEAESSGLVTADIGVSVQGYDADTAKYDDVTANFTGTLQNGGSNVVVDSDIGSTVQAHASVLDNTTASFTTADETKLDSISVTPVAVASLPGSPSAGDRAFVSDANATTFASVVAGGGSNIVPVYYDGTDWRIG